MANAFLCDRCGRFEEGKPVAGVSFNMPNPEAAHGSSARKTKDVELCSPCLASLNEWVDVEAAKAAAGG